MSCFGIGLNWKGHQPKIRPAGRLLRPRAPGHWRAGWKKWTSFSKKEPRAWHSAARAPPGGPLPQFIWKNHRPKTRAAGRGAGGRPMGGGLGAGCLAPGRPRKIGKSYPPFLAARAQPHVPEINGENLHKPPVPQNERRILQIGSKEIKNC